MILSMWKYIEMKKLSSIEQMYQTSFSIGTNFARTHIL